MRAIYHRFDGILTWKWVWSVLYWFGNEVAWAIDYRSTSFPGAAVQLIHTCQLSRIRQQSPGLPYGSPNLPDKISFWAFLCFTLEFIPFSPKIRIAFDSKFGFWGILEGITSLTKIISPLHPQKWIVMICNSCKTSYNVLSRLGSGSNCAYGAGGNRRVDRWYWGGGGNAK